MELYSKQKAEVQRHWRIRYQEETERRGQPLPDGFVISEPDDGKLEPPNASRVFLRSCCLASVALRGLAATWDASDEQQFLPSLIDWVTKSQLSDAFEPEELQVISTPAGKLDQQRLVDACWRWEGAAVLAASLGRMTLPAHDQVVNTQECGEACGLFAERVELDEIENSISFDPRFGRTEFANQALAVHWRIRQFMQGRQQAIDFPAYARGVQWAEFNLRGIPLIDDDLAIGDKPISIAHPSDVETALSIARERHQAANWLIGWEPVYSEVETPT
ncbi:DUF4272 domain-containing protein [Lacipirellula parvula]|uniref:DUF4272 domain-containing protein n=1 Tax=Lacipirellula parvula TaxID=2650471 RepID=A0A5K7X852_9BACT|nr:DUF4272 domain-containing protein [Lacipirellula parvula]BBO31987.1 hypothetical protein PLANPX_1599 [Lacipirellula parvula]